jgi:2-polyprenyl-3-methyl-5-hydroxy-6-metoxy-1,4-benzoquinol methylase
VRAGGSAPEFAALEELEPRSFWFRSRSRLIVWAIRRYFPSACDLLEVGCGTGFVLAAIHAAIPDLIVQGGELFDEGIDVARRRVPDVPVEFLDAREVINGQFDVVGAFDVIEHVADDEAVLLNLAQAIRGGGGMLLTVPRHRWLWSAADERAGHVRRYGARELVDKVAKAGLDVERVTGFVALLLPVMVLSRVRFRDPKSFDFRREFELPRWLDSTLYWILSLERWLIGRGISFPFGGSILLVAQKTASK